MPLNTRLGNTLCHGSWRTFFQPLTTSSPPRSAARKRGISCGSSCRSASSVSTTPPRAALNPAGEGRRLAEVPPEADARGPARPSAASSRIDVPRAVGAAVVHEDHLPVAAERAADAPRSRRSSGAEALLLVENGDDERDERRGRRIGGGKMAQAWVRSSPAGAGRAVGGGFHEHTAAGEDDLGHGPHQPENEGDDHGQPRPTGRPQCVVEPPARGPAEARTRGAPMPAGGDQNHEPGDVGQRDRGQVAEVFLYRQVHAGSGPGATARTVSARLSPSKHQPHAPCKRPWTSRPIGGLGSGRASGPRDFGATRTASLFSTPAAIGRPADRQRTGDVPGHDLRQHAEPRQEQDAEQRPGAHAGERLVGGRDRHRHGSAAERPEHARRA